MRDIPIIREIVRNAQAAGLKITTEAYVYGAGNSSISAAEFDPKDVEQRMAIHFNDFTLVRTGKDFTSKEEFVKDREASPGDAVIIHFLREDDNPHDASLLDMSVLYPGTAICTDSITWADEKATGTKARTGPCPKGCEPSAGSGELLSILEKMGAGARRAQLDGCYPPSLTEQLPDHYRTTHRHQDEGPHTGRHGCRHHRLRPGDRDRQGDLQRALPAVGGHEACDGQWHLPYS